MGCSQSASNQRKGQVETGAGGESNPNRARFVSGDTMGTYMFWELYPLFCLPVFVQAYLSYRDKFFTLGQMHSRGISRGLPFVRHIAMWSDALLFSSLAAFVVAAHASRWTMEAVVFSAAAGILLSVLMHYSFYVRRSLRGPHAHSGALTAAGYVHLLYMAAGLTVVFLFYLSTPGLAVQEMWIVTGLLIIHVFFGSLLPLHIMRPRWFSERDTPGQAVLTFTICTAILLCAALARMYF